MERLNTESGKHRSGDTVEVTVERIVPGGYGIGFAEGLTVFVPLSAPGDQLRVRIVRIRKRTAFAEIIEILRPGAKRALPQCPYFGACGGCDFQQLSYEAQLEVKVGIIRDCLRRIAKMDHPGDITMIASPEPLSYRSRARWQVDRSNNSLAYFARDSHALVPVRTCPKLVPELRAIVENFDIAEHPSIGSEMLAAADDGGMVSISSRLREAETLTVKAAGESYACSAEAFFQANRFLVEALIDTAIGEATGGTALDLYCGVGLFTLPLARRFERVIGVESHPTAAQFASRNVNSAKVANTEVVNASVKAFLRGFAEPDIDLVLLDPPRSGDDQGVIAAIVSLRPSKISYVSCEPSILARDLRLLTDAGYRLDNVTALDMFPQTHHVETVAQLSLTDFVP